MPKLGSSVLAHRTGGRRIGGLLNGVLVSVLAGSSIIAGGGVAGAAPAAVSADFGSLDSGSLNGESPDMPPFFREDPVTLPPLRDDITEAKIVSNDENSGQVLRLMVDSPALRRTVGLDVLVPVDNSAPRPTVYLLEGVDAGEDSSGWMSYGIEDFFADKPINVVMINGGVGSLYTDWDQTDPGVGLHKWETFITEELPPLIDAELKTNGVQSVAGNSMGAQGAMMLAHRNPDLYQGVVAMSGCYSTTDFLGSLSTKWTVQSRNGDSDNMWGRFGQPGWSAHDTVLNAEQLRGMDIYLSANSGLPGKDETLETPNLFDRILIGGSLEALSNSCTRVLDQRLMDLDIPATVDYEATGTHTWAYWMDQWAKAWPVLARSFGL